MQRNRVALPWDIATDGAFTSDGTFLGLPKVDKRFPLAVWQDRGLAMG